MCGIAGILNIKTQTKELRDKALKMAQKIRHRGPDWSGIYVGGSAILARSPLSVKSTPRGISAPAMPYIFFFRPQATVK